MGLRDRAIAGAEAGAVAAAGVAFAFFLMDVIHLQPLSTPTALSGAVLGPAGFELDVSFLSGPLAVVSLGLRLAAFTLLHFLTLALVGAAAAVFLDWRSLAGSLSKGALVLGALCTAVFYGVSLISESTLALESPGFRAVVIANVFAGLLIGGFLWVSNLPDEVAEASD